MKNIFSKGSIAIAILISISCTRSPMDNLIRELKKDAPDLEYVHKLMENGLDSNYDTVLFFAAYKGHKEIIEYLLKKGVAIDTQNVYGFTPLYIAAGEGYVETVRLLLEAGADITQKVQGKSIFEVAFANEQRQMFDSLKAWSTFQIQWADIPAGTFTMGSPKSEIDRSADEIQHEVTLSAFKMSKYEVTFEQYDVFCEATGRDKPDDEGWGRGNRPVINVSWHEANAFAQWLGCRLPTEAEWEYACRAGTKTPYNTGKNLLTSEANFDGEKTLPVGSFAPNAWGLYDMHGNVLEWCSDWYGNYPTSVQFNPKGPASGSYRVLRGGGWSYYAYYCRAARRGYGTPDRRYASMGFRLVSPK